MVQVFFIIFFSFVPLHLNYYRLYCIIYEKNIGFFELYEIFYDEAFVEKNIITHCFTINIHQFSSERSKKKLKI